MATTSKNSKEAKQKATKKGTSNEGKIAIIRVRGEVRVRQDIKDTLSLLHLKRANYCVVVDDTPIYRGMIAKAKDYITWGEIDKDTFSDLIAKWGRKQGDARITLEDLKKVGCSSFDDFAEKFMRSELKLSDIGAKPFFRLHPPSQGHERAGIKHHLTNKGALGYRGSDINDLIRRMAGIKQKE